MLDITKKIQEALGLDSVSEALFSGGEVSTKYTSFNDAGVECEVGEFLYALTRILKPEHALETGTHQGIGAMYIGQGLMDNGFGIVDTLQFTPEHYREADRRFKKAGMGGVINNLQADVTTWQPKSDIKYQLVLLDTEPQLRFNEFVRFFDYFDAGSYIFIHDLHSHMEQVDNSEHGYAWPWGKLPYIFHDYVKGNSIRPFHFRTPRGLTGFYKTHPEDHKW